MTMKNLGFGWQKKAIQGVVTFLLCSPISSFKIVHFGDSYSAGNGARATLDPDSASNYESVEGCYRSPTNWGQQLANLLGSTSYTNRACSGSVIDDMTNSRVVATSLSKLDNGDCPAPEFPPEEFLQSESVSTCSRWVMPQRDAGVLDGSEDLVLISLGANDLGFEDVVRFCFIFSMRSAVKCQAAIDSARDPPNLFAYESNMRAVLRGIAARTSAPVLLVGYPHITLHVPSYTMQELNFDFEVVGEVPNITAQLLEVGDWFAASQQDAVSSANHFENREFAYYFGGTRDLFRGHEPHPGPLTQNPDRWIWEYGLDIPSVEYYHLRPRGHQELALALFDFWTTVPSGRPSSAPSTAPVVSVLTNPPTETPMAPPVAAPVPSPPSGNGGISWFGFGCFSGRNMVSVAGKGEVPMSTLEVGDAVASSGKFGEFSPVYGFGHLDRHIYAEFLQFSFQNSSRILEITGEHLVFLVTGDVVRADEIVLGNVLVGSNGLRDEVLVVSHVDTVRRYGLYAPFTVSGNLFVSGALVSNYIGVVDQQIIPGALQHHASHAALAPWRLWEKACASKTSLTFSITVGLPHILPRVAHAAYGISKLHLWLQLLVFLLVIPILVLLRAIDIFDNTWRPAAFVLILSAAFFSWTPGFGIRDKKRKKVQYPTQGTQHL